MEYVAFEKEGLELLRRVFDDLQKKVTSCCTCGDVDSSDGWIENQQLAESLGISIRTLANYRLTGKLGFSMIGRKIMYKISDIEKLLESHKIKSQKEVINLRKK